MTDVQIMIWKAFNFDGKVYEGEIRGKKILEGDFWHPTLTLYRIFTDKKILHEYIKYVEYWVEETHEYWVDGVSEYKEVPILLKSQMRKHEKENEWETFSENFDRNYIK